MAGSLEELDPAGGRQLGGPARVGGGDDHVVGAPDDEDGHAGQLGEVLVCGDALSAGVHHRPGGGEEGPACVGVAQLGEALPRGPHVVAGAPAEEGEPPADELGAAADPRRGDDGQHPVGDGEGGGPQHGAHLAAEAAGADEDEPLDALGEEVAEGEGDPAAERVADDRDALDVEQVDEVAEGGGLRGGGVVALVLLGGAVAEEVGDDDPVGVVEPVDEVAPVAVRAEQAVDEEDRLTGAAVDVGQGVAVQRCSSWAEWAHDTSSGWLLT